MIMGQGSSITVYESDLEYEAGQGVVTEKQVPQLWKGLKQRSEARYVLSWTHAAYYVGTLLIIGSMTWWTSIAWQNDKSLALFWLALLYVVVFSYAGSYFWNRSTNDKSVSHLVGGLFVVVAVCISPVATYALERFYHVFPSEQTPHLWQIGTLVTVGGIAIAHIPFSFLVAPISLGLYAFAEIDLVDLLFGPHANGNVELHANTSAVFGGLMLVVAYAVQRLKLKSDFAFWIYLFATSAFWGGLTVDYVQVYNSELFRLGYFSTNVALVGLALVMQREVFLIAGGAGTALFVAREFFVNGSVLQGSVQAVIFGGALTASAVYIDRKYKNNDFSFWGSLFGMTSFWSGLTAMFGEVYTTQPERVLYLAANLVILSGYLLTKRDVFIFYGSLGMIIYVGNIIETYFSSFALPILLTLIGLALIALAVWWSTRKAHGLWIASRRGIAVPIGRV